MGSCCLTTSGEFQSSTYHLAQAVGIKWNAQEAGCNNVPSHHIKTCDCHQQYDCIYPFENMQEPVFLQVNLFNCKP